MHLVLLWSGADGRGHDFCAAKTATDAAHDESHVIGAHSSHESAARQLLSAAAVAPKSLPAVAPQAQQVAALRASRFFPVQRELCAAMVSRRWQDGCLDRRHTQVVDQQQRCKRHTKRPRRQHDDDDDEDNNQMRRQLLVAPAHKR